MKIKLGTQCLLALVLGLLAGHFITSSVLWYISPIGDVYLRLLELTIVPLTFSTIVTSFAKYEDFATMRKIGGSTLFWFVLTAFFAGTVGLVIGTNSHLGAGLSIKNHMVSQLANHTPSIRSTLINMVPSNIIAEIAKNKIIPVIIFAIFFGLALSSLGNQGKTVRLFFSEFSEVMFKITRVIIKLSPIGIFVLMAQFSNEYGFNSLIPLAKFIVMMYLACMIQIIIYLILLMVFAKTSPIRFIRDFFPAMITAYSTSSSMGTLPVTMERLVNNLDVRSDIVGFVAPLGANMKMDACGAIFPAMVCILTANLFHMDLTIVQYILIFVLSVIASFCTVGMPGVALMSATFVLVGVGFPLNGLAIVLGVDRVVDMMRTMTNITGTATCAVLVDRTTRSK